MRGVTIFILGLLCVLAASSCGRLGAIGGVNTIKSPNGRIQVNLPRGWEQANLKPGENHLTGTNALTEGFFLIIVEQKVDLAPQSLDDYVKVILKIEEQNTSFKDRILSAPTQLSVDGYPADQYILTATKDETKLAFVKTFFATPTEFVQVMCWTRPSRLSENQADFAAIVASVHEPVSPGAAGTRASGPGVIPTLPQ